ncbi:MAG: 3-hydroxyacyl-CoA dehydrogenase [Streptomyces sp.]|nr:3-hydroxyacyl-CoA dehydrogenase [Streptomyces sp.]
MIDTSTSSGRAIVAHDRYPALDELQDTARALAARHPRLCRVRTVGASRAGQPLVLLSVGDAADNVLIVAGAHPDELVGGATVMELAHRILAEPAQCASTAWHFLLCADPDGARLVRGHCARSLPEFFAHYFRPASAEQPEHAPSLGVQLPESRILLGLIDDLRPFVQFSLHGIDVGGTFVQATRDVPGLAEPFARSAAELGIPIESGSYDTLRFPEPAPGVFVMPPPDLPPPGARTGEQRQTTWFAPHRYGGATVIVEAPMWACDRMTGPDDGRDPQRRLAAFAARLRRRGDLIARLLDDALSRLPSDDDPFVRSVRTQLTFLRRLPEEWDPRAGGAGPAHAGRITEARLAGMEQWTHRLPTRAAAMLRRAVAPAGAPTAQLTARLDALLCDWTGLYQRSFPPVRVPVARQAAHQASTVQAAVALSRPGSAG